MYLYFSCEYPSVIKTNGIIYGKINGTVKFFNLENGSVPLIEIVPLSVKGAPFAFYPDGEFLSSPPNGVSVTDLKGGYLIKIYKRYEDKNFNIIAQEKNKNAVVTVFSENGYKVSVETERDFYADSLPFSVKKAKTGFFKLNGNNLLYIEYVSEDGKILEVFDIDKQIKKILVKSVNSYFTDGEFKTVERFSDVAKHTVSTLFNFSDGKLTEVNREITTDKNFDRENLNPKIIPYAFMEEFFVKGDYGFYLTGKIKQNADNLSAFFGDFIGVCPPPVFRSPLETGVIYKQDKNKYKVEYYTFSLTNGKIENIIKV